MTAARPRGSGSVDATTDLGLGAASAEDPTVRGRVSGDDGDASAEQETEPCPMVTAVNLDALSTDAGKPTKKLDELPPRDADEEPVFRHPEQIGPFRILRLLGEGGMGAVYLAEQSEPVKRQVALKLVHASLRSPMALARFTAERQAMARLSPPVVA